MFQNDLDIRKAVKAGVAKYLVSSHRCLCEKCLCEETAALWLSFGAHSLKAMPARRSGAAPQIHLARRVFARSEEAGLRQAFKQLGWAETPHPAAADVVWDIWLNDAEVDQHASLVPGQLLNRFPAMADCA